MSDVVTPTNYFYIKKKNNTNTHSTFPILALVYYY